MKVTKNHKNVEKSEKWWKVPKNVDEFRWMLNICKIYENLQKSRKMLKNPEKMLISPGECWMFMKNTKIHKMLTSSVKCWKIPENVAESRCVVKFQNIFSKSLFVEKMSKNPSFDSVCSNIFKVLKKYMRCSFQNSKSPFQKNMFDPNFSKSFFKNMFEKISKCFSRKINFSRKNF